MLGLVWFDIVGLIGILAACGGLYYLSSRIEPHWVAKDQSRFLTAAQDFDDHGVPIGRRRDVRVHIDGESDALLVSRRSMLRPSSGVWTVKSKSTTSRGKYVYMLRPASPDAEAAQLALRVPASSRVVARLDELLELTGDEATLTRERERYRAARDAAARGSDSDPTGASGSPGTPPPAPPADPG